jgi:hypothetical protein
MVDWHLTVFAVHNGSSPLFPVLQKTSSWDYFAPEPMTFTLDRAHLHYNSDFSNVQNNSTKYSHRNTHSSQAR